jgi:hypothetical protein
MKKTIFTLSSSVFLSGVLLTSCNTPAENVDKATQTVQQANQDLETANKAYLADIESCKKQTLDSTNANEQSIADFKLRIAHEKGEAKAEYEKKISDLESKNTDMRKKMDDYKAEGKDKWETFKTGFNHEMHELGEAFRNLTRGNQTRNK